ncbi:acetyl-CoA carboxylase biotin carboxyl carrier protein [Paraburkholderia tropica]|uniref:acetyl-CoA carboxylase biotin carboxyl carrier protein n=1 Tax=Paraburkholderia tropica TaxID=92647 RepID=UPI002AB620DB|nr:acetyl-CoA carboxylase biotin carboxyl carrier protein subunit [Paraburkholderia tropica]
MDIGELRQITSWLAAVDIEFIEISKPGTKVRLTLERAAGAADASATDQIVAPAVSSASASVSRNSAQPRTIKVSASSAGIFLTMHPARSTPLVEAGAQVKPGDVVGLLQIAQLCVPVLAPIDGVVTQTLAAHGATVGYGTPLLELSPAA